MLRCGEIPQAGIRLLDSQCLSLRGRIERKFMNDGILDPEIVDDVRDWNSHDRLAAAEKLRRWADQIEQSAVTGQPFSESFWNPARLKRP